MNTLDYMKDVVVRFNEVLLEHNRHMELFDEHAVQVEGWFKGELLHFFHQEKANRKLKYFCPECPPESLAGC